MAKAVFPIAKAQDEMDVQRRCIVELLRSDMRLKRQMPDDVKKAVKKLDRMEAKYNKLVQRLQGE